MNDKKIIKIFFTIFFLVGAILHIIPHTHEMVKILTPLTLIFSAGFVLYFPLKNTRFRIWFFPTLILTFALEAIGVETGMIFGAYNYGSTLGIKFFDVPIIIALNWVCVVFGAITISDHFIKNRLLAVTSSAILCTGFDYVMEPSAIHLDYWTWHSGNIPLLNYISWFFISLIASTYYLLLKPAVRTDRASLLLKLQLVFFAIISFSLIFR